METGAGLDLDFAVRFLTITLIDLALSGDNAVVIGMAAASLPRGRRPLAIAGGAGLAILLRVVLTTVATLLMQIPLLSAAGGLVLFWVAWRLLAIDTSGPKEQATAGASTTTAFRQAITLIVMADVTMSVDNVLAVAGAAHGNIALLVAGLVLSMPLLMTTGGAISMLIDRFSWLVYAGAAAICMTGTRMVIEDSVVATALPLPGPLALVVSIALGLLVPYVFARRHARDRSLAGPNPANVAEHTAPDGEL
jgi:YjbE family integral membrane protein